MGQRIECAEDATSTSDIDIDVAGVDIDTTEGGVHGIKASHAGTGNIEIDVTSADDGELQASEITTTGGTVTIPSHGIDVLHTGTGDVNVRVETGTTFSVEKSYGIYVDRQDGSGEVTIDVDSASFTARGDELDDNVPGSAHIPAGGVFVWRRGAGTGDVRVTLKDTMMVTEGWSATGVTVRHQGTDEASTFINAEDNSITVSGFEAVGIYASRESGEGDLNVSVRGGSITATDTRSHAILATVEQGDVTIDVRDTIIATTGTGLIPNTNYTLSTAIRGDNYGNGGIDIDMYDGSITTNGSFSYGIRGNHTGDGLIAIDTHDGNTITTTGSNGHGIVGYHFGSGAARSMHITVGGTIDARGAGAHGVLVGLDFSGAPERVASIGADGYRQQTVTVNGSVRGNATGVFLAGGGRVVIGPQGSIASDSGIAILATGTVPAVADTPMTTDIDETMPAITPKLRVDMNLNGRRVAEALGDGWILNDGGETTIAVNGTVLHDGATGVTENTATNGAWDVTMQAEGVNVTDYADPDPTNWTTETATTAANRDFSTEDFTEAEVRCPSGQIGFPTCRTPPPPPPPPPPMCPEGQIGTPPNCTTPPPPMCPEGQIGTPPNCMTPPPPMCPDGQVGMPPNCTTPPPPMCPEGQIGTPPNCMTPPPPMCPDGQVGMPPNCTTPPPPMCPEGQVGTPPNCTTPPPPMCPDGQVGMPPNCTTPPPPMCPEGQVGTPPNCTTPPPPMCPEGQVGMPQNCTEPEPEQPMFMEEYAPRAALYEALPGFLLRLTGRGPAGAGSRPGSLSFPESPVWVRFSGGGGTSTPDQSSVGVDYDFTRFQAELGVTLSSPAPWAERLTGSLAIRHTQGSTTVASPTGGGALDAQGLGVAFGVAYQGVDGAYFNGWGLVTHYDVDVASEARGLLKRDAGVLAHAFGLETGHRVRLTAATHLTPRVWLVRSHLTMDRFTDTVDAQVALQAAEHLAGGVGLIAATQYVWDEEQSLSLRGSLDVEQAFNDRETVVDVSGESLMSDSKNTRVLLGLGGSYHWGHFSLNSEVSVGGLDSGDQEIFGQLTLGVQF